MKFGRSTASSAWLAGSFRMASNVSEITGLYMTLSCSRRASPVAARSSATPWETATILSAFL